MSKFCSSCVWVMLLLSSHRLVALFSLSVWWLFNLCADFFIRGFGRSCCIRIVTILSDYRCHINRLLIFSRWIHLSLARHYLHLWLSNSGCGPLACRSISAWWLLTPWLQALALRRHFFHGGLAFKTFLRKCWFFITTIDDLFDMHSIDHIISYFCVLGVSRRFFLYEQGGPTPRAVVIGSYFRFLLHVIYNNSFLAYWTFKF